MTGKTHMAAGALAALLIGTSAPGLVLVGVGAMLPDIDHGGSKLGARAKPVSAVLRHRGFTHSLAFLAIAFLVNPLIGVGVFVHLLLDFLTPKGEQLLWPMRRKWRLPIASRRFETGGRGETILFLFLSAFTVAIIALELWRSRPEIHDMGSVLGIWRSSLDMIAGGAHNAWRVLTGWFR